MEEAVGPNGCWVFIHGMSAWHVRSAVHSMQYYDASSGMSYFVPRKCAEVN
jgi:hypothetical protein